MIEDLKKAAREVIDAWEESYGCPDTIREMARLRKAIVRLEAALNRGRKGKQKKD